MRYVVGCTPNERGAGDSGENINAAHIHANTVLTAAAHRLPDGHHVSVEVAHGRTIEEAIDDLEWDEAEILIVGSCRLAEKNKLFIGSTARDYERINTGP